MALTYLRHDVTPLLHGRYSAVIGKALFAATGQQIMALAWMAYDAAHHDLVVWAGSPSGVGVLAPGVRLDESHSPTDGLAG